MAKKTYTLKPKVADKKKVPATISELIDSVILLADRQDKYDDNVTRLTNAQQRLQATFDNMIDIFNRNSDMATAVNMIHAEQEQSSKEFKHELTDLRNLLIKQNETIANLQIRLIKEEQIGVIGGSITNSNSSRIKIIEDKISDYNSKSTYNRFGAKI